MKTIYQKYNTPIGSGDKGTAHSYIDEYYSPTFEMYRHRPIHLLEIGINYGLSLKLWREYFSQARITAIDIQDNGFRLEGTHLIYGDATAAQTIQDIHDLDIVIDDGSHWLTHQLASFELLWPRLNPGGRYIIEDIQDIDASHNQFLALEKYGRVRILDYRKIKGRYDDVIVEIVKI
jgi:cephalosporin hydroxylase